MNNPLDALREAKPNWTTDSLGVRGNAQERHREQSEIRWPRPETVPPLIVAPSFPSQAAEVVATAGSAASRHPFQVYSGANPPIIGVHVYPGKIGSMIPKINGVFLNVSPAPLYPAPNTPFQLFLRVKIDTTDPVASLYRTGISEGTVVSDQDAIAIPDIDPDVNEILEWKIFWEDEDEHLVGHFYIRIADIQASSVEDNTVIGQITQWLYTQFRTFIIYGDEAIPIV